MKNECMIRNTSDSLINDSRKILGLCWEPTVHQMSIAHGLSSAQGHSCKLHDEEWIQQREWHRTAKQPGLRDACEQHTTHNQRIGVHETLQRKQTNNCINIVEQEDKETRDMKTWSELHTTCKFCVQRNTSDITEPMMFMETQACSDDLTESQGNLARATTDIQTLFECTYNYITCEHKEPIEQWFTPNRACADCSAHEATPSMSQGG
jgi:hypothetical protein